MKRRHSQSSSPEAESPEPSKRLKVTHLERGFSYLSLNNVVPPSDILQNPQGDVSHLPSASSSSSQWSEPPLISATIQEMDIEPYTSSQPHPYTLTQPTSIEEPSSPTSPAEPIIPEIKMKGSSWYEPEPDRIVVTDLDSSDDDEDSLYDPEGPFTISPALLQRIRERDLLKASVPPDAGQTQALTLYRPPLIPLPPEEEEEKVAEEAISDIAVDDDKMDVEPL
ncbi:hypothetical protein Moror_8989 [Moniliophthora roreri MCA 2997]|uniref:Uncharacterized protein n=1 Tax=Moniliophthora roreri (strain MCA 2997) TaxID=1381753 RepID=V2XJE8_MONRO|nr:hypothetical protein Moror_8989 [Moniliophthora roreri MCA 2997]